MRGFLNIGTKPLFLKWKYYRQRINVAATTQRLNSNKCRIYLKIVQRVHITIIVRFEDRKRWELNPRPCTPHFFLLCFSSIPAPWYSGWLVRCMLRDLVVAYLEICGEPYLHPRHPNSNVSWLGITALCYQCLLMEWEFCCSATFVTDARRHNSKWTILWSNVQCNLNGATSAAVKHWRTFWKKLPVVGKSFRTWKIFVPAIFCDFFFRKQPIYDVANETCNCPCIGCNPKTGLCPPNCKIFFYLSREK